MIETLSMCLGTGGKGRNPSKVPGILGRIRADSGIHIATGVDVWAPMNGGANYVQAGGGAQPTFSPNGGPNGGPCVNFDGSNDSVVAVFIYAKPAHIFVVGKWNDSVLAQTTMLDGVNVNSTRLLRKSDGVTPALFDGAFCNLSTTSTAWHIYRLKYMATTCTGAVDTGAYAAPSAADGATGGGLTLGAAGGGVEYGNVSIAEVIPYSRILSVKEDANIVAYLKAWYNI